MDGAGNRVFAFAPPRMADHAGARSAALTLALGTDSAGQIVTLTADAAWLADPARVYPVTIDPDAVFYDDYGGGPTHANQDCGIVGGSSASTNFCTGNSWNVGDDGSKASRALLQFDVTGAVPAQSQVEYAELGFFLTGATTATTTALGAYPITRAWTTGATWNTDDGTNGWTTAGGDFQSAAADTIPDILATGSTGEKYFDRLQPVVQQWVDGRLANDGLLLKEPTESVTDVLTFVSGRLNPDLDETPYLSVNYEPWLGQQRMHTFARQALGDRMDAAVNVANGDLSLRARDLAIAGTGLGLLLDRYYDSLGTCGIAGAPTLGGCWAAGTGDFVGLQLFGPGSVVYNGPGNYWAPFVLQRDGSFATPSALDAMLVKNTDGTYTLTFHQSGTKQDFNSGGTLTRITDTNGNHLDFSYNTDGSDRQITDTQGRTIAYSYTTQNGVSLIATITDGNGPATRTVQCGYDATTNALTSVTDLNGKVTHYAYTGTDLTQVTDPVGNVTKVAYDSGHRVTAIIRVTNSGAGTGRRRASRTTAAIPSSPTRTATRRRTATTSWGG